MFHKLTNCGTHVWVQGAYSPVRDSDGKISRIIFSFLDVTEFEKNSENNVQQIQAIQKSTGVIELNVEGTIISANHKLCDMLNCEQTDLAGKQYGALFDEDQINFKEFYDNLLTKVYNGEFELRNCKWKPKMNDDKTLHGKVSIQQTPLNFYPSSSCTQSYLLCYWNVGKDFSICYRHHRSRCREL